MILRKPYAFLMKHFKKINIVLLILTTFIFIKNLSLLSYTKEYSVGNTVVVEAINSFFSVSFFLVIILIILIAAILLFLLKRKDKPIKTYVLIISEYIVLLFLSFYFNNFFNDFYINGYDRAMARTVHGFNLIVSIPQYLILLLLFIRSIGLDLKSFGFQNDKEFLTDESDREEVEVEVGLDKDKLIRKVKKTLREFHYFIKEHRVRLIIILVIVLIPASLNLYKNVYLVNKVYKMNQTVSSNYYNFVVNDTYITTKNYRGDIINKDKSYVIVDLDIKNTLDYSRTLDIEKFTLLVDGISYTPTVNFNEEFEDLGNTFKKQALEGNSFENYFLIFEIDSPNDDSNFILRYQDITSHSKLIRIKLSIKDISNFVLRDTKSLNEEISVKINKNRTSEFTINSYELGDSFTYTYETCNFSECYIKEANTSKKNNKTVLFLRVTSTASMYQTLEDVVRYGKIRYVISSETYEEKVSVNFNKKYRGNFMYFDVNKDVVNASSIELVLTIRNNQYIYKLR